MFQIMTFVTLSKGLFHINREEGYTAREMEIIKAVAGKLFISEGTVKNYITAILAKEKLSHRTALAVYYLAGKKQADIEQNNYCLFSLS